MKEILDRVRNEGVVSDSDLMYHEAEYDFTLQQFREFYHGKMSDESLRTEENDDGDLTSSTAYHFSEAGEDFVVLDMPCWIGETWVMTRAHYESTRTEAARKHEGGGI